MDIRWESGFKAHKLQKLAHVPSVAVILFAFLVLAPHFRTELQSITPLHFVTLHSFLSWLDANSVNGQPKLVAKQSNCLCVGPRFWLETQAVIAAYRVASCIQPGGHPKCKQGSRPNSPSHLLPGWKCRDKIWTDD